MARNRKLVKKVRRDGVKQGYYMATDGPFPQGKDLTAPPAPLANNNDFERQDKLSGRALMRGSILFTGAVATPIVATAANLGVGQIATVYTALAAAFWLTSRK